MTLPPLEASTEVELDRLQDKGFWAHLSLLGWLSCLPAIPSLCLNPQMWLGSECPGYSCYLLPECLLLKVIASPSSSDFGLAPNLGQRKPLSSRWLPSYLPSPMLWVWHDGCPPRREEKKNMNVLNEGINRYSSSCPPSFELHFCGEEPVHCLMEEGHRRRRGQWCSFLLQITCVLPWKERTLVEGWEFDPSQRSSQWWHQLHPGQVMVEMYSGGHCPVGVCDFRNCWREHWPRDRALCPGSSV